MEEKKGESKTLTDICRHCGQVIAEDLEAMPEAVGNADGSYTYIKEYITLDGRRTNCREGCGHSPISEEELEERGVGEQKRAYEVYLFLLHGHACNRVTIEFEEKVEIPYGSEDDLYPGYGSISQKCAWDCLCPDCVRYKLNTKINLLKVACPKCGKEATDLMIIDWVLGGQACLVFKHGFTWVDVPDFFGGTRKAKQEIRCFGGDDELKALLKTVFESKEGEK